MQMQIATDVMPIKNVCRLHLQVLKKQSRQGVLAPCPFVSNPFTSTKKQSRQGVIAPCPFVSNPLVGIQYVSP